MIAQTMTDAQFARDRRRAVAGRREVRAVADHRRDPAATLLNRLWRPSPTDDRDPRHPVGRLPGDHRIHRPLRAGRRQAEPGGRPRRAGHHLRAASPQVKTRAFDLIAAH